MPDDRGTAGPVSRLHRRTAAKLHPLPSILKENGWCVTGGFGKWHLTPGSQMGQAGPFDHWPLSWGFDHWWGFLTGAAGQYDPITTQDNTTTGVPGGKDGKLSMRRTVPPITLIG